jgi:hypothetical protein
MLCSTILGLLSVLKNSVRRGTIVDMPSAVSSVAREELVRNSIDKWHLSSPWLRASPHETCMRAYWSPSRVEQCSSRPGAFKPPRLRHTAVAEAQCRHGDTVSASR